MKKHPNIIHALLKREIDHPIIVPLQKFITSTNEDVTHYYTEEIGMHEIKNEHVNEYFNYIITERQHFEYLKAHNDWVISNL